VKAVFSEEEYSSVPTEALVHFIHGAIFGLVMWWLEGLDNFVCPRDRCDLSKPDDARDNDRNPITRKIGAHFVDRGSETVLKYAGGHLIKMPACSCVSLP
jgi:hypothetical protein